MHKIIFLLISILLQPLYSQVIWNETTREDFFDGELDPSLFISHRDDGTIEFFARFDVNNDGYYDIAAVDGSGPYLRLYLGSETGYDPSNVIHYPITSGGGTDIADLNFDGWPELIHCGYGMNNIYIYWGTPTGPDPSSPTLLPQNQSETVYCADFDKDGYIDISVVGLPSNDGYVYWGSATGYSPTNRTVLVGPQSGAHNIEVADFDRDSWLDIVVVNCQSNQHFIYYGGAGRTFTRTTIPYLSNSPHGCSTADLNDDGWLDLVFTGYSPLTTSYIYWGGEMGFTPLSRTIVNPGQCYGGSVCADWNEDGLLDIIYLRSDNSPPILYENTGSFPYFEDTHRSPIGSLSFQSSGGFVADLDFDGSLDIYINNTSSSSYILWGPDYTSTTALPVNNDHHGTFREPGSIYNRHFQGTYRSTIFDAGFAVCNATVDYNVEQPPYSEVKIFVRSGQEEYPDDSWTDWIDITPGTLPLELFGNRYFQYEARLHYGRPSYLPMFYDITFEFTLCPELRVVIEHETLYCRPDGVFIPNPIDIEVTVINDGQGDANDVYAYFNLPSECTEFVRDSSLHHLRRLEPGDTISTLWILQIDEGCAGDSVCIDVIADTLRRIEW